MKQYLAALAAALLAGGGLYGALAAADRKLPPAKDVWLDAWVRAGLKADFRAETDDPEKTLQYVDGRDLFKGREAVLRHYLVMQTSAQVVELSDADVLQKEFPEGRHPDLRLKPKGGTVHACRVGRTLLLLSTEPRSVPIFGNGRLLKKVVERIFETFEEAAR